MRELERYDDLMGALENNYIAGLTQQDIEGIILEVPGANDEYHWWWVVMLTTGEFVMINGWCDYTGWDCQSGAWVESRGYSLEDVIAVAPTNEGYSGRNIRQALQSQAEGILQRGVYQAFEEAVLAKKAAIEHTAKALLAQMPIRLIEVVEESQFTPKVALYKALRCVFPRQEDFSLADEMIRDVCTTLQVSYDKVIEKMGELINEG